MSDKTQETKGLLDYIHILLKWRRFIVINFLLVVLITYGITLLLPKWHYSQSIVLPPKDQMMGPAGGLPGIARMVGIPGAAGLMGQQGVYNYLSILKSRSIQVEMINEFDLRKVYDLPDDPIEDVLREFQANVDIVLDDEGALVIGVYDRDPNRAAEMANRYVSLLHKYYTDLNVREASSRREFVEKRLAQNKEELEALEERMRTFQTEHGFIVVPDQIEQGMKSIAEMYAIRTIKELELDVYKETLGPDNPLYKGARLELNAINNRLSGVPDQTVESLRIFRELMIQQKIFELLTPMLEEARLEELRDTPTVLVLDEAVPSDERARPKRLLVTLAMGVVSLIVSISYVLTNDILDKMKETNPDRYNKVQDIRNMLKNPLRSEK